MRSASPRPTCTSASPARPTRTSRPAAPSPSRPGPAGAREGHARWPRSRSPPPRARRRAQGRGSPRRYTLPGLPGSEFPQLPAPAQDAPSLELPVEQLALLITRTHFSISTDETRAHVNSALFEWAGDRVRMVTTDGHRLSKMEATVGGSVPRPPPCSSRSRRSPELRRLARRGARREGDPDGRHHPEQAERLLQHRRDAVLGEARRRAVPALPARSSRPSPSARSAPPASRSPRPSAPSRSPPTTAPAASSCRSRRGRSGSPARAPTPAPASTRWPSTTAAPEVTIGFNAKYFLDVLASIDDEEVILGISGELDPAVIRPGSESNQQSYVAVIMPMRIERALDEPEGAPRASSSNGSTPASSGTSAASMSSPRRAST